MLLCPSFYPACMECQRGLATRKMPVCPSVRPSICQTRDLWQNERKSREHAYTTWQIIHPSFVTRRVVGGGDSFYLKFWVKRAKTAWLPGFINGYSDQFYGHHFMRLYSNIFYASAANNWRREALSFSVVQSSVNTYFAWRDISVFERGDFMKLRTNIHQTNGHCWKGLQGQ